MKNKYLLLSLLAMLLAFGSMAQNSSLQVHVDGTGAATRAVVLAVDRGQLTPVDTIGLDAGGNFRIVTDEAAPAFFLMRLTSPSLQREVQPVHVLLLPGEQVTMTLLVDPASGSLRIPQSNGSANMDEYRLFQNMLADAMADPAKQSLLPHQVEQLLVQNRGNLISAFLVTFFENDFSNYASLYKYIYDALVGIYPNHEFVQYLGNKTKGMLLAGMQAPDISMPDRNGQTRRLSDLRGKVVLVDFWASWCRPCRMENPNVVRLYHEYHDKGFEVFSVSLDKTRDGWLSAIEQDGLVWDNHVSDLKGWTSSGGKTYGISSIPATVLVGPDGTILARNLRGNELAAKLAEIFEKK